jgi:uncharacterized peroxidase-related enzyme
MSWIESISPERADARLARVYQRVRGPGGEVDNILRVHGLRPHTLEGHMALYRNVLHHNANVLPEWLLETVGVRVSMINGCDYCVAHHVEGLGRLLGEGRAEGIVAALRSGELRDALDARAEAAVRYAEKLTRTPAAIEAADIDALRAAGLDDGEILEVNQVASYFAYANRTASGLGVTTAGDVLGLSPRRGAEDEWRHG